MENSKRSIRHTLRPSPTAILNPRCDPIFKAIFTQGTEKSNFALKDLISSLLGRRISEMELLPNEEPVEILDEKQMSFDVNVTFDDGEKAELEMQGRNQDYDYASRAEIHAAKLLSSSNKRGSSYDAPNLSFHHKEKISMILRYCVSISLTMLLRTLNGQKEALL